MWAGVCLGAEELNWGLQVCAVRAVLTESSPWSQIISVWALKLLEVGVYIISNPLGGMQGETVLN